MSEQDRKAATENPADAPMDGKRKAQQKSEPPIKKPAAPKPPRQGGSGAMAVALLGLLAAGGVGAGGWYLWQELQQLQVRVADISRTGGETAAALAEIRRTQQQVGAAVASLNARIGEIGDGLAESRRVIDSMGGRLAEERGDWSVAEVEYLLRIAQRAVNARDVGSAIAAMRSADERIQAIGDARLQPVRAAIAEEMHGLRSINQPDVDGISAELAAITGQIQALPLATAELPKAGAGPQPPAEIDGWRTALERIGHDLRGLITIRRGEAPAALTTPDRRFFLRQNLQLKLETARLALLERRQTLYGDSLDEAGDWLRRYFHPDDAAVTATLERIETLGGVDVSPALPSLGAALQTLRRVAPQIEPPVPAATPAGDAS